MSKLVLLKAETEEIIKWLEANIGPRLPQPSEEKFIPFAIGERWTLFVHNRRSGQSLVEIWLPEEATSAITLRFLHAEE